MLIIIALGGNALLKKDEQGSFHEQETNFHKLSEGIEKLRKKHTIVITHGNGPQVGNLLLQQNSRNAPSMPLDVCDAMTQGQIGYLIQKNIPKTATILTQVLIDKKELKKKPSKPVGPYYTTMKEHDMVKFPEGWRKVVVSPKPKRIIEINQIKKMIKEGFTVVCCGGGGIPVTENKGALEGHEAVIDKDYSTALLAKQLKADMILFYTSVENVYEDYPANNKPVKKLAVKTAEKMAEKAGEGSMKPKLEASVNFLKSGGKTVIITNSLDITGKTGTVIK